MTKDELLATLKKLNAEEELAIPIYTQHLNSTFFLSGFKPEVQKEIKEILLTLARDSQMHARLFKDMIEKVEKAGQDVY